MAKQASLHQLNYEQIQRSVEASNTIAYLKVLGMSDDRTVEFPLAKFAEVMQLVCLPEGIDKQADMAGSRQNFLMNPKDEVNPFTGSTFVGSQLVDDADQAKEDTNNLVHFVKETAMNKQALENLEIQKSTITDQLMKLAEVIAKDNQGLDKLASVVETELYSPLSVLITGAVQTRRDFGDTVLFKQAELKDVNKLAELFKEAKRIVVESSHRAELQKRAEVLNKQAGVLSGLAGIAGKAVGTPFAMAGKALAAPFKDLGRQAGNLAGSATSAVKGTPFTPKPMSSGLKKTLAAGTIAGSAGLDAAMYNPGKDLETGRSNDVWSALQRD